MSRDRIGGLEQVLIKDQTLLHRDCYNRVPMTSTTTTSVHEVLKMRTEYCVFGLNFSLYHLHWSKLAKGLMKKVKPRHNVHINPVKLTTSLDTTLSCDTALRPHFVFPCQSSSGTRKLNLFSARVRKIIDTAQSAIHQSRSLIFDNCLLEKSSLFALRSLFQLIIKGCFLPAYEATYLVRF